MKTNVQTTRNVLKNVYKVELSLKSVKQYGDIISAFIAEGGDHTAKKILGIFNSEEDARNALKECKSTACLVSGSAGTKFYSCDFFYTAEENFDGDEWSETGNYDFSVIEVRD